MILYYAIGGGWGHITRASAFMAQLSIPPENCLIISPYHSSETPIQKSDNQFLQVPNHLGQQPRAYHKWLSELIEKYKIQEVFLDSFPLGIVGEWVPFLHYPDLTFHYIARLLRWGLYASQFLTTPPSFQTTWILEKLKPDQLSFIQASSVAMEEISLQYPQSEQSLPLSLESYLQATSQLWLIVHSGPEKEIEALLHYARRQSHLEKKNPQFLVINPGIPPPILREEVFWENFYPARALYPRVDRIFTAAGFNCIQETRPFAHKHQCLPFSRKYDDQFFRWAREKEIRDSLKNEWKAKR